MTWKKINKEIKEMKIPKMPDFKGKGIITCGGDFFMLNLFLQIKQIRHTGCKLPIEIFYINDELSKKNIEKLEKLGVTCKSLKMNFKPPYLKHRGGWQSKTKAMLECSFKEFLWLDVDCFPILNPEALFEDEFYQLEGALFWRNIHEYCLEGYLEFEKDIGIYFETPSDFEAGQLMMDKERCWKALNIIDYYNQNPYELIYHVVSFGDCRTFFMGLKKAGKNYTVNIFPPTKLYVGRADYLVQKNMDDENCFLHLTGWTRINNTRSLPRELIHLKQYMREFK